MAFHEWINLINTVLNRMTCVRKADSFFFVFEQERFIYWWKTWHDWLSSRPEMTVRIFCINPEWDVRSLMIWYHKVKDYKKHECIPVGCVTSAAGVSSQGGCLPMGVSTWGTEPQTLVKTLPCPNYVADGKYWPLLMQFYSYRQWNKVTRKYTDDTRSIL